MPKLNPNLDPSLGVPGKPAEFTKNVMGHVVTGQTITDVMHTAIRGQLMDPDPDVVSSIETHNYNTALIADSCEYSLDVGKNLWLNIGRWSRLIKEYVPREPMERFVLQAKEIMNGGARDGAATNMMFRDPTRYGRKHRWGGCIMGATFLGPRSNGTGKCFLTFYSRTTYIGYMGLLDAAMGHVLARYINEDPSTIGFRWYITSSQLHCFKTLPFLFSQEGLMKRLDLTARRVSSGAREGIPPAWYYMSKWYLRILRDYERHGVAMLDCEKYGPLKRIKRRWLEYKGYLAKRLPPSLPVSHLTFDKAE